MKRISVLFLLVFILFGLVRVAPVAAFEMRQGNDITVPKDTVVKGSLFAAGNTVTVDGTINGDLYCAGQTIVVHGTVAGDVLCAGQTLDVSGTVGGNIRSMGQLLNVSGVVRRNVVLMGQTLSIGPAAVLSGELLTAGQTLTVDGRVAQDVVAAGQSVRLNSAVVGNVTAYGETISLGEKARVAGDLTYTSNMELSQATGAAISGRVTHLLPPKPDKVPSKFWMPKAKPWPARAVGSMVFYLIVGVLVVLLARDRVMRIATQMKERPWLDFLVGFLTMIGAPIVIMMVTMTIIGIPIAIILAVMVAVMLILSRIYVAVIVGDTLLSAVGKTKSGLVLQVVIGVVLLELLIAVFLGFLVSCAATLWGLGGIVMNFGKRKAK